MQFAGEYIDSNGLYNLRARQYDVVDGRFLNRDPIHYADGYGALSPYGYARNRPAVLTDPSGMCSKPGVPSREGPTRALLAASGNSVAELPPCGDFAAWAAGGQRAIDDPFVHATFHLSGSLDKPITSYKLHLSVQNWAFASVSQRTGYIGPGFAGTSISLDIPVLELIVDPALEYILDFTGRARGRDICREHVRAFAEVVARPVP